jgi:hypothetical protein
MLAKYLIFFLGDDFWEDVRATWDYLIPDKNTFRIFVPVFPTC